MNVGVIVWDAAGRISHPNPARGIFAVGYTGRQIWCGENQDHWGLLWGDTVNTASRMESHGAAGSIQVTEATYKRLTDDFICEPRGMVAIKGKGMPVWYVLAART